MATDEIEKAHLEIERERLEFEKSKAQLDRNFFRSNSGILISSVVSLAVVFVSLSQVWITKVTKDKELELASMQKKSELDLQDKQKEHELMVLDAPKKREWDLNAAKFITDNRKAIFNGTPDEQKLFAKIIGAIYPTEIAAYMLVSRIERASPPGTKKTWREVRKAIEQPPITEGVEVEESQTEQEHAQPQDIVPVNIVIIRNKSNVGVNFFLRGGIRQGKSRWLPFHIDAGVRIDFPVYLVDRTLGTLPVVAPTTMARYPLGVKTMPTILGIGSFRFHFYSDEGNEPPHIHAATPDGECKF